MLGDAHLVFGHRRHLRQHRGLFLNSWIVAFGSTILNCPPYVTPAKEGFDMVVIAVPRG